MQSTPGHTHRMRYATGSIVGERGQVTIEKELREKLGVKPRDAAIQWIEDGRLVMIFVPHVEPHMRSLAGILGPPPRGPKGELDLDEAVGKAIAEEWREYLKREGLETAEKTEGRHSERGKCG